MKKVPLFSLGLSLVGVLFAQESRAEDYTRFSSTGDSSRLVAFPSLADHTQAACAPAPCDPGGSAVEFRQLTSGTEH